MQREGKCSQCQKIRTINTSKCRAQSTEVPSKRKRCFSEISNKSGISALSAQPEIDEDDDLECDGPSSDVDATDVKIAGFHLQSVGSVIDRMEQTIPRKNCSRDRMASQLSTVQASNFPPNRQIAQQRQNYPKQHPRLRNNFSESDCGNSAQRPNFGRRHSMFDQDVMEDSIEGFPNDNFEISEQNFGLQAVRLAGPVQTVRSVPNLKFINRNTRKGMNLHDNANDDSSGYVRNEVIRPNIQQANIQQRLPSECPDTEQHQPFDSCLQNPTRLKFVIVATIVIAWVPVAILTVLLLTSVHKDPPLTTVSPPNSAKQTLEQEIDNLTNRVDAITTSHNVNSAPLRLEGVGVSETDRNFYKMKWSVPSDYKQNAISLVEPDIIHVRVDMTGYYVVFSAIHFIGNNATNKPFTIQHTLYKVNQNGGKDDVLDTVSQNCMLMDDRNIEHTSTMQTIAFLHKGSQIYIRVRGEKYLDKNYKMSVMGIFLLPQLN